MNQKHPTLGMTLGFMVPVIPSVLVDYTAARLETPPNKFLSMVIVGMFPTSFIYAFGGDAIFNGDIKKLAGALIGIAILFIMAWWLVNRASRKKVSGKKLIPKTWKKNDDFLFDFIVLFLYFNCLPWYY